MTRLITDLRRFDADLRPPRLEDAQADVAYVVEDTAVGRILLARRATGELVASGYAADGDAEARWLDRLARTFSPRVLRQPRRLDDARRELAEYLDGRRTRFDLALDLGLASDFQRTVLGALAHEVGYGERTSYGALASAVDRPRAARAVGAALGSNPLCILLPCHRVVAGSGALTGYAGGVEAKRYLLELESRPRTR